MVDVEKAFEWAIESGTEDLINATGITSEELTENRWQKKYCEVYFGGHIPPRYTREYEEYILLGYVKSEITVYLPGGLETYKVQMEECNMPNGIIDPLTLASNLTLWTERGYKIKTR